MPLSEHGNHWGRAAPDTLALTTIAQVHVNFQGYHQQPEYSLFGENLLFQTPLSTISYNPRLGKLVLLPISFWGNSYFNRGGFGFCSVG